MNSSAGMPLSTWTFLKTSSAISGFSAGAAWPPANATHTIHTIVVAVAQRIVRDPSLMLCPFVDYTRSKYTSAKGVRTVRSVIGVTTRRRFGTGCAHVGFTLLWRDVARGTAAAWADGDGSSIERTVAW